jgi:hypothetical protein
MLFAARDALIAVSLALVVNSAVLGALAVFWGVS